MRSLKPSTYLVRTKWAIVVIIALILIIFSRTVQSPSLTRSAIVIGVGVDFKEDKREFEVTAQSVLMASSSDNSSAQTSYMTYTSSGKTISGALDDISRKMGLTVSLAYCEVLFLSESALKLDHLQLFYPLTGMYALREQTIVVTGDKSPREMLATRIGTTVSAPYFLQSALLNQEGTDGMIRTNAKNFLTRSLSRSHAVAIPYIVANEMQDQPMDDKGESKDNYEFDLSKILVLSKDKTHILDESSAEILALYLSEATYGALNYTFPDGQTVEFRILEKYVSTSSKGRIVKAKIKLSVDLLDVQFIPSEDTLTAADPVIKRAADMLAKDMELRLKALDALSKELNIDFLGLQAKAYQSVGRSLEEDALSTIDFQPSVSISIKEAS